MDLKTAPDRQGTLHEATGLYVRAQGQDGRWDTYDMAELDRDSLVEFIRSRGEVSTWAVHITLILLGHDRLGVD